MTTTFLSIGGRWLNASLVRSFVYRKATKEKNGRFVAQGMDFEELGDMEPSFDPEELTAHYIPAAYECYVLVAFCYHTEDRPTVNDLSVERHLVLGWRAANCEAQPVLAEPPERGALVAIPTGDKKWTLPYDVCGLTTEEVAAKALELAQQEWDRKHPVSEDAAE